MSAFFVLVFRRMTRRPPTARSPRLPRPAHPPVTGSGCRDLEWGGGRGGKVGFAARNGGPKGGAPAQRKTRTGQAFPLAKDPSACTGQCGPSARRPAMPFPPQVGLGQLTTRARAWRREWAGWGKGGERGESGGKCGRGGARENTKWGTASSTWRRPVFFSFPFLTTERGRRRLYTHAHAHAHPPHSQGWTLIAVSPPPHSRQWSVPPARRPQDQKKARPFFFKIFSLVAGQDLLLGLGHRFTLLRRGQAPLLGALHVVAGHAVRRREERRREERRKGRRSEKRGMEGGRGRGGQSRERGGALSLLGPPAPAPARQFGVLSFHKKNRAQQGGPV